MKKCSSCGTIGATMTEDGTHCARCDDNPQYCIELRATEYGLQIEARSPTFNAQFSDSWSGMRHAVEKITRRPIKEKDAPKLRAVAGKES